MHTGLAKLVAAPHSHTSLAGRYAGASFELEGAAAASGLELSNFLYHLSATRVLLRHRRGHGQYDVGSYEGSNE